MTEEQTTPEEPAVFSGDFDGLKKAAAELNDARESGQPISAPEPEPKEAVNYPTPREVKADPEDFRKKLLDKGPYLQFADWREGQLDAHMGAEAISRTRSEGDEALRQMLENDLDLRQQVLDSVDQQNRASEQLSQTAAEAQAQIDAIRAERDQKAAEAERLKAEKQVAERINQQASEIEQYQAALHQDFFDRYPEADRFFRFGDARDMTKLAYENPVRYREIVQAGELVDDMVLGRHARVNAQKQQLAISAAKNAVEQVRQLRSDYQGDAGLAKMRADMDAAIEARVAHGEDRQAVLADIDRAENYTAGNIEAFLSMGREYRARQGLESKRARPKLPPVMKPGVGRDPRGGDYSEVTALDQKLNATHNVKDAGKLLAAMRRAAR